jgi:hypothetical protein
MSTSKPAKRPVLHIEMTPELEVAIRAAPLTEGMNPADAQSVRDALSKVARTFEDPAFFYDSEPTLEIKSLDALISMATLLREHLRAGNLT